MNQWIHRLFGMGGDLIVGPRPSVIIKPMPSEVVLPPARFAWDEKGWRRIREGGATQYVGSYRIFDPRRGQWRTFDGRVIEDGAGFKAYVSDPPPEIRQHQKGPCFQLTQLPWFRVHWHTAPTSVDSAFLYVERILDESLRLAGR